jgi:hypothetical protein
MHKVLNGESENLRRHKNVGDGLNPFRAMLSLKLTQARNFAVPISLSPLCRMFGLMRRLKR